MKSKKMTMRELHARMAKPLCKHCGKLKEEHLPVMAPERVEYRCLDAEVCSNENHHEFEPR